MRLPHFPHQSQSLTIVAQQLRNQATRVDNHPSTCHGLGAEVGLGLELGNDKPSIAIEFD